MKVKTVTEIDYNELDKLVHDTWPSWEKAKKFKSVAEFEWCNDSSYEVEADENDYDSDDFMLWLNDSKCSSVGPYQLFAALAFKGVLQSGNYLVIIYW